MKYNDFIMLNEKDYQAMKQSYDKIQANEIRDLNEILNKMKDQKESLLQNNTDSRYDRIIEKLDDNISELETMISTSSQSFAYSPKSPEIPSIPNFLKKLNTTKLDLNDPNGAISPVRGTCEINNHMNSSNLDSNTPIDYNLNNTLEPYENNINYEFRQPSPAVENSTQSTTKRNSPMQGSIISNLVKKINLNFRTNNKSNIDADPYRMRFHNTQILNVESCQPRNKLFTNQIDIIRLILLYMILRPNNRHISRLASIANDQFEMLLQLEK